MDPSTPDSQPGLPDLTTPTDSTESTDSRSAPAGSETSSALKRLLKGSVLFLSLTGIIIFAHAVDLTDALNEEWADVHLRSQGTHGILLYICLTALLSAIGCPRQALAALGGYAFGASLGTLWCSIALVVGCAGGFFYARLLGRSSVQRRFGKRVQKMDAFLTHRPFVMSIAIRCLPVGNNALTTMVAGITSIPPLRFIAGSGIGYLPQTVIFALLGSGIRIDPELRITASALLFALSSYVGYRLYRSFTPAR